MNGTAMQTKGSTFRSTLDFILAERGAEPLERVLAALVPRIRVLAERAAPTDEIDYDDLVALWAAAEAELAPHDPLWMEHSGAYSIGLGGAKMYGGILRKRDPSEFLTQSVSLFRLYYHPGDMEVVEHAPGRAVLRLVGFDPRTSLFCRRQTGGLSKAIEMAGGESAITRHVRCAIEGDAYCEWELTWISPDRAHRDSPLRGVELA